jgi:peroxiredoxin
MSVPVDVGTLPRDLPVPVDDGACDHLVGMRLPPVTLPSTRGGAVDLGALGDGRSVIFAYPMTGRPGVALPDGWDAIPGARGCTPQNCAFRDLHQAFLDQGAAVYALSTQTTAYQSEMAERLHLPYPVLSDADFALVDALRLPTFVADGMRLIARLTLVVRSGAIEHVFYPVFPPDRSAEPVLDWLTTHPIGR